MIYEGLIGNTPQRRIFNVILLISLLLIVVLECATWDMLFWPTDTEVYYFDMAIRLPHLGHISQIHQVFDEERVRWLHGKEFYIMLAAIAQPLLNDFTTLRPFLFICIVSFGLSAILIFLLARRYWGQTIAIILYFLFVTSFWPYIYILMTRHQPLGLFLFLLSVFLLHLASQWRYPKFMYFCSGLIFCLSFFSSPVSILYLPYYVAAFFYEQRTKALGKKFLKEFSKAAGLSFLGGVFTFVYFNSPDIVHNIKSYLEYIEISCRYNHFFYNQMVLQQWFPSHLVTPRGGWLWIMLYLPVAMPILFPVFLISCVYLLWKAGREQKLLLGILVIIFLAWSSPILAEIRQVAQYGANYYTAFVGILLLIGCALSLLFNEGKFKKREAFRKNTIAILCLLGSLHVSWNSYVFFTDIYPTRMVTTYVSRKLEQLGGPYIFTYLHNPHRVSMIDNLKTSLLKSRRVVTFDNLPQVNEGYILVPPVSGDSIYIAATSSYADFDKDVYLNELIRKKNIGDYAVASYPTMASSRIWLHEEEILSYRYLILRNFDPDFVEKGKVWILDAKKLKSDFAENFPSPEYKFLHQTDVSNIGTKRRVYLYKGYLGEIKKPMTVKSLAFRMYKIGQPTDQLVAYLYKIDSKQELWVPHGVNFKSLPVDGSTLAHDPVGGPIVFQLREPLVMDPGRYCFIVYRTGKPDNDNFYRIYNFYLGSEKL